MGARPRELPTNAQAQIDDYSKDQSAFGPTCWPLYRSRLKIDAQTTAEFLFIPIRPPSSIRLSQTDSKYKAVPRRRPADHVKMAPAPPVRKLTAQGIRVVAAITRYSSRQATAPATTTDELTSATREPVAEQSRAGVLQTAMSTIMQHSAAFVR